LYYYILITFLFRDAIADLKGSIFFFLRVSPDHLKELSRLGEIRRKICL